MSTFFKDFKENRDVEQYFWTNKTVNDLKSALDYFEGTVCCLCTPTLAVAMEERAHLFDLDKRFQFLSNYHYFDMLNLPLNFLDLEFDILVFDPPFFYIEMQDLFRAVCFLLKNDFKRKLMMGFQVKHENLVLEYFKKFNLKRTKFFLEYENIKSERCLNYALYSNICLPGISIDKAKIFTSKQSISGKKVKILF